MTASEVEQLRAALETRLVIGQAQGILMERLGIDACRAIEYLKRASNELNLKLFVVAADIVRTRALPRTGTSGQESQVWQTTSMSLPVPRTKTP